MARKLTAKTEIQPSERKPKRGRKKATKGATNGSAPTPGTNTPDEILRNYLSDAVAADVELKKATDEAAVYRVKVNAARGKYRKVHREASDAGCDTAGIRWYVENRGRSPEEIDAETRSRNRVARLMGLPIGTQLGMFHDGETIASKVDGDILAEGHDAQAEGRTAGEAGRAADTNPYDRNSRNGIRWMQGWDDAQFELRQGIGRGPQSEAAAPVA
jgi:hypothetical protein